MVETIHEQKFVTKEQVSIPELTGKLKGEKLDMVMSRSVWSMTEDGEIFLPGLRSSTYGNNPVFAATGWAHGQIAEKLDIPKRYYDRMLVEDPSLLARNVNTWRQKTQEQSNLIRTLNGTVRAFVSDKFRCLDNYEVLVAVANAAMNVAPGIACKRAYVTERSMNVELVDSSAVYYIDPQGNADPYYPALSIVNSEVGYRAFEIRASFWRQVCSNGMMREFGFRQVHLGGRAEEGDYWSQNTIRLNDATTLSKIQDFTAKALGVEYIKQGIRQLRGLKEQHIEQPIKFVLASKKILSLTEPETDSILRLLEGNTRYDYVQALTATAQIHITDNAETLPERKTEIEEIAGRLVEHPEAWKQIERAAATE